MNINVLCQKAESKLFVNNSASVQPDKWQKNKTTKMYCYMTLTKDLL